MKVGSVRALLLVLLLPLFQAAHSAPSLGCQVGQQNAEGLKPNQIKIANLSPTSVKQGTVINLSVHVVPPIGRSTDNASTFVAYRDVTKGAPIFAGDTPVNGRSCSAKVALVQPSTTLKVDKPVQSLGK